MSDWLLANWLQLLLGGGGVGGLLSAPRVLPAVWRFVVDAGQAPYYRSQAKLVKALLKEKTSDYDELLNDYRICRETLETLRRSPASSSESSG